MKPTTPELRLLFASTQTITSPEDEANIRNMLARGVDWTRFARKAVDCGLAGPAGHALAAIAPDLVPDDILDAFRINLDQMRRRNLALLNELAEVIEALAQERVGAIPLGGPVLAIKAHGSPDFCVSKNLDLLLDDSAIGRAISILRSLGYEVKAPSTRSDPTPGLHGPAMMRKEASGSIIQLHARLAANTMVVDIDYAGLWRRARHTDLPGRTILTLAPEDELLILALQGGKDLWWNVKAVCDVAALIASNPQFDGIELLERARAQGCGRMLLLATALARRCVGSALPDSVTAAESADPVIEPMIGPIITRWQDEPGRPPGKRVLAIGRLQLHDGLARRARYLARTVFSPGPDEVASRPLARILGIAYRPLKLARDLAASPLSNASRHVSARAQRWQDALGSSDFLLALLPADAEKKRHQNAGAQAKRALAANPGDPAAWDMLGDALFGLKRYTKAIACYEKAIALLPEQLPIWTKRSAALEALGKRADLPVDSGNLQGAGAWAVRAAQLWALRRFEEAAEAGDRALEADPHDTAAARISIQSRLMTCDWSKRDEDEQRIFEGLSRGETVASPFAHRCMRDSESESLVLAQLWTRKVPQASPLWRGEIYRHKKIRIAYVSPDLRNHVVPDVIAGCFEQHDRTQFETTAVSLGPDDGSEMRRRLEAAFDRFIDARAMPDDRVAAMLRELEIDIAIDLYASPDAGRSEIFARRPAPLQVNYLGYPGTKGAFLDYIIADPMLIPGENRKFYSEQVVYLPHTYMPTDPKRAISAKIPGRADAGLPETGFVFACHHPATKIGPEIFDIWMRLLRAVDGSILWLRAKRTTAMINLRREARARGVAPERLVFAPHTPDSADHLARLTLADLFLDALPFNAHSSGCDVLRVGLPVLTCVGNGFAGRVGASMLHAVGLPELVTASLPEYEALALTLAQEPDRLAALRAKLLRNRDTEPLFDTARFTRHLESAYIAMHERHQAGLPLATITVPSQ